MKVLTNKGRIEEVDEIEEVVVAPKENQTPTTNPIIEPTKQETKQLIKETNQDPEAKRHKVIAMKKSTYVMIWVTIGILLALLVWSNTAFSLKDFAQDTNVTVNSNPTINVDSSDPQITTPIHNNITINTENKIEIPLDIINNMTKEIADKIILELNCTNVTG